MIVAEARLVSLAERVEALGTLRAYESVDITANVSERISRLYFDDGQRVREGDLLVELTSVEQQALLEDAKVRADEAERQYRRVAALVTQGSASESLRDERRRDLDSARAQLVALESRLADRIVKAPFDGVLGLRRVSRGAWVAPGDVITTLDDDSVMKLDFNVPSLYLPWLEVGLAIEARARSHGDRVFEGVVRGLDSRVDPVTRSIQVRALIPNPERTLKPGLLMQVTLLANPRETLLIPEAALMQQGQSHAVARLVEDADGLTSARQPVRIGTRQPGLVEIVEGLDPGDRVISHGQDRVRPGQPLAIRAVDDGATSLENLLSSDP